MKFNLNFFSCDYFSIKIIISTYYNGILFKHVNISNLHLKSWLLFIMQIIESNQYKCMEAGFFKYFYSHENKFAFV